MNDVNLWLVASDLLGSSNNPVNAELEIIFLILILKGKVVCRSYPVLEISPPPKKALCIISGFRNFVGNSLSFASMRKVSCNKYVETVGKVEHFALGKLGKYVIGDS